MEPHIIDLTYQFLPQPSNMNLSSGYTSSQIAFIITLAIPTRNANNGLLVGTLNFR
jgi:hypothetical protein